MSAPASRPDLLRLLAQSIFGEQARLFPWEERESEGLMASNRPAELKPAQRERPSDLRDMSMSELERLIVEQEEAQKAGAAEAIHNIPASPVAGLVAAASPDTYANMAETEGPGGEAPTMAAALTGLETTGGPGHPLTPRMEAPTAPGGRVRPAPITGAPLPDPRMKGMPIDHLKNEHTARWWDKFERAQEAGPVALEKARDAAKRDWDTRFKTWQVSNEPPQPSIVDQDFVIPSEGSAAGVEPKMFQPAKSLRPANAAPSEPKPEKPKFIDPSAVSVVADPLPEAPPPPPGGITVDPIEGKAGAWRIRDPKSGLEQEFIGDRETADKHAKWLAQLSLRAEAREKLKAAKAAEKPKEPEAAKEPEPPAEPAPAPEPPPRADLNPASPGLPEAEALARRTAELQKKQLEGTVTPEETAEINTNINTNRAENAARVAPEPPPTTEKPRFAVGDEVWLGSGAKTTILEIRPDGTYKVAPIIPGGKESIQTERNMETRNERMLGKNKADKLRAGGETPAPPAMTTGGGVPGPRGLPPTRGQRTPKNSPKEPVVGRRSSKPAPAPTEKEQREDFSGIPKSDRELMSRRTAPVGVGLSKLTVPEPPPGPPGETGLTRTLGLKYTPPTGKGAETTDYRGNKTNLELWHGIEPAQKKQMLKNKELFDRILAGVKVKESEFPSRLRGPRKSEAKLEGPSVQEYLKALGKDVEDVSPASVNWDQYNARQNAEFGSRTGLKEKPVSTKGMMPLVEADRLVESMEGQSPYIIETALKENYERLGPEDRGRMQEALDNAKRAAAFEPPASTPTASQGPAIKAGEDYTLGFRADPARLEGARIVKDKSGSYPWHVVDKNGDTIELPHTTEAGAKIGALNFKTQGDAAAALSAAKPADTPGANAFHAKLMGALEKRVMGNEAGTVSGKKTPGQTGRKFSKSAPTPDTKPLPRDPSSEQRAVRFEHKQVEVGDEFNQVYNVPAGHWVVVGIGADKSPVYIDSYRNGPMARDIAGIKNERIAKNSGKK